MKRPLPVSIFVLLASSAAGAALAEPESGTSFRPRFEAMRKICLERDYANLGHEIVSPKTPSWDYSMGPAEAIGGTAFMKAVQAPVLWVRSLVRRKTGPSQSEKDLAEMTAAVGNFADSERLGTWERACLSKCVTAHMIAYTTTTEANFLLQPARIAEKGIGVCKQYAMLGEYLSNALGVESVLVSDDDVKEDDRTFSGHVYNRIAVDGVSYYSEPQDDRCIFMNLE